MAYDLISEPIVGPGDPGAVANILPPKALVQRPVKGKDASEGDQNEADYDGHDRGFRRCVPTRPPPRGPDKHDNGHQSQDKAGCCQPAWWRCGPAPLPEHEARHRKLSANNDDWSGTGLALLRCG